MYIYHVNIIRAENGIDSISAQELVNNSRKKEARTCIRGNVIAAFDEQGVAASSVCGSLRRSMRLYGL